MPENDHVSLLITLFASELLCWKDRETKGKYLQRLKLFSFCFFLFFFTFSSYYLKGWKPDVSSKKSWESNINDTKSFSLYLHIVSQVILHIWHLTEVHCLAQGHFTRSGGQGGSTKIKSKALLTDRMSSSSMKAIEGVGEQRGLSISLSATPPSLLFLRHNSVLIRVLF